MVTWFHSSPLLAQRWLDLFNDRVHNCGGERVLQPPLPDARSSLMSGGRRPVRGHGLVASLTADWWRGGGGGGTNIS